MSYKSQLDYTPSTLENNNNYFSIFSKKTGNISSTTVIQKTIELFKKNPDYLKTYVTFVGYFNNKPVDNGKVNKLKSTAMTVGKRNGGTDLLNAFNRIRPSSVNLYSIIKSPTILLAVASGFMVGSLNPTWVVMDTRSSKISVVKPTSNSWPELSEPGR